MIWPRLSIFVFPLSYCVTASTLWRLSVVQEYLPVGHRLRLYRPQLSSRLTLRGRTFLRKPLAFDGEDSHLTLATHTGILSCASSTAPDGTASA